MSILQIPCVQVLHALSGRLRTQLPVQCRPFGACIEARLRALEDVTSVRVHPLTGTLLIHADPAHVQISRLLALVTEQVDQVMRTSAGIDWPVAVSARRRQRYVEHRPLSAPEWPRGTARAITPYVPKDSRITTVTPIALSRSSLQRLSAGSVRPVSAWSVLRRLRCLAGWLLVIGATRHWRPVARHLGTAMPATGIAASFLLSRLPLTTLVLRALLGRRGTQFVLHGAALVQLVLLG